MNVQSEILLDFQRRTRTGLDEAVYCAGKSVAHIVEILELVEGREGRILLTRLDQAQFDQLPDSFRARLDFDPLSRTAFFPQRHPESGCNRVAVISAGTSDASVAREASRTLEFSGEMPLHIADVGVAGLWRLMDRLEEIRAARVVVAVAGMDAAMPTVLGGLIDAPIVGVPTSVGYGAAESGQTALKAMLASCASGLTVTNIDNGYGGACAALRILGVSAPRVKA